MESEILALDEVMDRVDGDIELFEELVAIFVDDYPLQIDKLEKGVAAKDPNEVSSVAHALKSALGNIGAMRAFAIARSLEDAGRDGDVAEAPTLLQNLKDEVEQFKNAFADWKRSQSK